MARTTSSIMKSKFGRKKEQRAPLADIFNQMKLKSRLQQTPSRPAASSTIGRTNDGLPQSKVVWGKRFQALLFAPNSPDNSTSWTNPCEAEEAVLFIVRVLSFDTHAQDMTDAETKPET